MICVHHLGADGAEFWINPDLVRSVERRPDTVVNFTDGTQMYVGETPEQLIELIASYRAALLRRAFHPDAAPSLLAPDPAGNGE